MKKTIVILTLILLPLLFAFSHDDANTELVSIQSYLQVNGDANAGYNYLVTGDFLKSGIPYGVFTMVNGKNTNNLLGRTGKNATVGHNYNVIKREGSNLVVPTCLQCHASMFDGKLVMGLGNANLNFTRTSTINFNTPITLLKMMPKQYRLAKPFISSMMASFPLMETETPGVNVADMLAVILVAHRDPQTLVWNDKAMLKIPEEKFPTDVPAWWLMKKKNAMFYNGFARGDMSKFMMLANLLTVKDSSEAREVSSHFGDVLAYIRSIQPPKYPYAIDAHKADEGRVVFNDNCSRCHGTYGAGESYPNLLVPEAMIQTDSLLYKVVETNEAFTQWFSKSWFTQGSNPAHIVQFSGYLAPPLDGIWVTAPYLHNGSVPTLEALLDSKQRPKYWTRFYNGGDYDTTAIGWKYETHDTAISKYSYNTTLKGYGNYGHYFGDNLTQRERTAVIEYLKTL